MESVAQQAEAGLQDQHIESLAPFGFTGKGSEFFRIWIVNIFLSILTLGIYSAWAKVRTLNYFYGNTWLAGNAFSYLASPIAILKGRLVAVAFLALVAVLSQFYPLVGFVLSFLIVALTPWVVVFSLRFTAVNSAYRNIRFNFNGGWAGAAMAYVVWPLLGTLSLLILFPLAIKKEHQYRIDNHAYGTTSFEFSAGNGAFYKIFFGSLAILALAALLAATIYWVVEPIARGMFGMLVVAAGYLASLAWFNAGMFNVAYQGTRIGQHRFNTSMTATGYAKLMAGNVIGMILTVGLFYPFARVRVARYKAQCLSMRLSGSIDDYVAAETDNVSALGSEMALALDLGIGQ